jgi:mRNA-degrading endonuclease RelE of RelBE toxin-antitoxin system
MPYEIVWTEPAEKSYLQLKKNARACIDAGQSQHPAVLIFNEVENALETTLTTCPCNPDRALAGVLSIVYKLPLRTFYISYLINPSKPIVTVLTIARKQQSVRTWLNTAIEDGTVDGVLAQLGIEKPCINVEVNEHWTH